MRIAYLINQYPQTSQSFIRREINALEAMGVTIDRFTLRAWDQQVVDPGDLQEKLKARVVLGVGAIGLCLALLRVFCTRPLRFFQALKIAWKMGKKGDRGKLYHLIYLAEACVLLRWLRQCGAEHVHAHFGTNSTTVALLVHALGGPGYSFTCHGPEEFDRPLALKLGEKIARARFVVAISNYGRSQLFRWCDHAHWHKIHVVHCGVDDTFLKPPPAPMEGSRKFVCVGRLAEQKGQLLLIQAARILKDKGCEFELILAGDGPMRKEIEEQIARCLLGGQVHITGWISNDQVRDQLTGSRAMILPSFAEGLPVVVMEALALGRLVIGTYVAGIPELVSDGICGYLVPAGSVERLAEAMFHVLELDMTTLERMGCEGARRVANGHNVRREASKLAGLFGRAVGQGEFATEGVSLSGEVREETCFRQATSDLG